MMKTKDISVYTPLDSKENEPDMFYAKNKEDSTLCVAERFPVEIRKSIDIEKLKRIQTEHLLCLKAYITKKPNFYIFFDYCNGGNIDNFRKSYCKLKGTDFISEAFIQRIIKQIVNGLDYLHKKNIIHGFLSCSNVWINYRNYGIVLMSKKFKKPEITAEDFTTENIYIKTRFYCCKRDKEKSLENIDIIKYMAPEILEKIINKTYDLNPDSPLVDSWSLGVILFKLLTGYYPFEGTNALQIYKKIKEGQITYPKDLIPSLEIITLINNLLRTEPSKRLSLDEIKDVEFYKLSPEKYTFVEFDKETNILLNCSDNYIKWYLLRETQIEVEIINEEEKLKFLNQEISNKINDAITRKEKILNDKFKFDSLNPKKKAKKEGWYDFDNELVLVDKEIDELTKRKLEYEKQLSNYQQKNN